MFKLAKSSEGKMLREAMVETLCKLSKDDERVLVFDADLGGASGLCAVESVAPGRFIDCGIQEANMVGLAAGTSESGAIPFTHTFACFASRKCIDQIFLSACYAKLNIKMIGTDPGISATTNGGSHMGLEDMGTLNSMNNITLLDITDAVMLEDLLPKIKDTYGVFYMRVYRRWNKSVYEQGSKFEIGKGNVLRHGKDITIIASGIEVPEALTAAEILEGKGISARVVDLFTWRPLDKELIVKCAKETGAIVTAENHYIATGLGHSVAAVVAEECPVPMGYIGIDDQFGEVGDLPFLLKRFKMTAEDIAEKAIATIAKK